MYRGEVHRSQHEAIIDTALFEEVQGKLAAQAVARRGRLQGSAAILTGRLFDSRGHRMSPSHTNKCGARYRYYVSQVVRQGKPQPAGLVGRVPAAELEAVVVAALRDHLSASGCGQLPDDDRDLLERHLERVTLTLHHLELRLRRSFEPAQADNPANKDPAAPHSADATTITVHWTSPLSRAVKGIIHVPAHNTPMTTSRRESLLMAIAKARSWVDELATGRAGSLAALAGREGKVERHVRLLLPLAFVSPRIVSGLLEGTTPAGLTITALARALPWCWDEQERRLGLLCDQRALPPAAKRGRLSLELERTCMR